MTKTKRLLRHLLDKYGWEHVELWNGGATDSLADAAMITACRRMERGKVCVRLMFKRDGRFAQSHTWDADLKGMRACTYSLRLRDTITLLKTGMYPGWMHSPGDLYEKEIRT